MKKIDQCLTWPGLRLTNLTLSTFVQGNKKGPIKRWDFETEEDYHSYMESREALPK